MATLRGFLNGAGFDWGSGSILVHSIEQGSFFGTLPGWASADQVSEKRYIALDDEILDEEFNDMSGGPECPRFVAEDKEKIYFPAQYDGSTWIVGVYKDFDKYLSHQTPYPGRS